MRVPEKDELHLSGGSAGSPICPNVTEGRLTLGSTDRARPRRAAARGRAQRPKAPKGGAERVTRLYRRGDLPEDQCWLRAPGLVSGVPLMRPISHPARPARGGIRAAGSLFPVVGQSEILFL